MLERLIMRGVPSAYAIQFLDRTLDNPVPPRASIAASAINPNIGDPVSTPFICS